MKYEVIIFDADETLFDFRKSEKEAFKSTVLEFGMEYDENYHLNIYHGINSDIWKEFEKGLITQEKLRVERFKRLSDRLDTKFDEAAFAKAYGKHLANASFLFEDSMALVENLYKDYRLTIVTNGLKDVQHKRIRESALAKYFEDIVISEEVNIAKPDARIFELALSNLNHTDKTKVLIVGDSLSSDIRGGVNSGIDTCWYNPNRVENNTDIKPTYEISSLIELLTILEEN